MKAHNYFNVCFTISGESADRELVEFSTVTRPSHLGDIFLIFIFLGCIFTLFLFLSLSIGLSGLNE